MMLSILKKLSPAVLLLFMNCSSPSSTAYKLDGYFQEYFVFMDSYTDSVVTCRVSFTNTKDGLHHQLPEGYTVCLDNAPLTFDKDEKTRDYTAKKTVKEVTGDHVWKIKDNDKTVLEIPFTIKPFRLISQFPVTGIGPGDVVLKFEGLDDGDRVECDYENANEEIEDFEFAYIIKNNTITIPAKDILKIKPGVYKIWIDYAWDKAVINKGVKTGRVIANYGLIPVPVTIKHQ
jgi:hypothetical protein